MTVRAPWPLGVSSGSHVGSTGSCAVMPISAAASCSTSLTASAATVLSWLVAEVAC